MVGDPSSQWLAVWRFFRSVGKQFSFFPSSLLKPLLLHVVEEWAPLLPPLRHLHSLPSLPSLPPSLLTNHLVHFSLLFSIFLRLLCMRCFLSPPPPPPPPLLLLLLLTLLLSLSFSFHPVSTWCVPMGPERELMLTYLPPAAAAARLCLAPSSLHRGTYTRATRKY